MGLDQSFYDKKPKFNKEGYFDTQLSNEILYFRKYPELHDFIGELNGETVKNAEVVRLNKEELIKLTKFIQEDKNWRFNENDTPDDFKPTDEYFRTLGILTYYAATNKPLFYMGDW